jgi:hypothetical protein
LCAVSLSPQNPVCFIVFIWGIIHSLS